MRNEHRPKLNFASDMQGGRLYREETKKERKKKEKQGKKGHKDPFVQNYNISG